MDTKFNNEIEKMKSLINFGNDVKRDSSCGSVLEYKAVAADGKTYGILRESGKYYIKCAPKKDTELVAEDFDYIGGFMNRKQYEYNSYPLASKQLDLKLMSINEAYESGKKPVEQFKPVEDAEWQVAETKEMRKELNRFNQILENVNNIMENKPQTGNATMFSTPFSIKPDFDGTKDLKDKEDDPKKAGSPFSVGGTVTNEMLESDKKATKNGGTETYSEDVKEKDGGVAAKKTAKGKSVKFNESKERCFKLTEEQVLAWNRSMDYIDDSKGTEIGSSEPYEEEGAFACCGDDGVVASKPMTSVMGRIATDEPRRGLCKNKDLNNFGVSENTTGKGVSPDGSRGKTGGVTPSGGSGDGYEASYPAPSKNPMTSVVGVRQKELSEAVFNSDTEIMGSDAGTGCADCESEPYDEKCECGKEGCKCGKHVHEAEMHDFGKHPAYRKRPMTVPDNREIDTYGRDWNDDSAKKDEPFGQSKGDSAPYTEDIINMLTDAITDRILKKKV